MKQLVFRILSALRLWFFQPSSPENLGVARILIYGFVLFDTWDTQYRWETQRSSLRLVGIYRWLSVANDSTLNALLQIGLCAGLLCMLGIAFRPAAIVAACTLPYALGLGSNFGKIDHGGNLLAVALVILAFSRAADGLSIAAWWRKRTTAHAVTPSGEYRWPLAAIWLTIVGMYCSAGIAKLANTGWEWAFSNNFQLLLLSHQFTHSPPTKLGVWLAQYPWLCQATALAALLGELLCPLMLLGGGWTLFWGGCTLLFQLGIYLMLGVAFRGMIPLFLTFVPWFELFRLGTAWSASPRPAG